MKPILLFSSLAFLLASCGKQETTTVEAPAPEPAAATAGSAALCPVSGEELGSMGDPYVYVYEGREIKMCCEHCVPKFEKDPQKYLSKLDAEAAE
ncbi:hypothetical protein [Luteolibacter marinus]|uniref:hypothetical protein n=1 Tax=Luteolibacter marinus TaxID=2776705 RepID=UPI001865F636|nr:hypothetical protein [Luteolibacter marinus]